jgi:hypothetical protein
VLTRIHRQQAISDATSDNAELALAQQLSMTQREQRY